MLTRFLPDRVTNLQISGALNKKSIVELERGCYRAQVQPAQARYPQGYARILKLGRDLVQCQTPSKLGPSNSMEIASFNCEERQDLLKVGQTALEVPESILKAVLKTGRRKSERMKGEKKQWIDSKSSACILAAFLSKRSHSAARSGARPHSW